MDSKKPWFSKTIVVNFVIGALMAVAAFVPAASGIAAWIQANATVVGVVWSVLNIGLRAISKGAISLSD